MCSRVRVPTSDEEDAKRPHREREHLVTEKLLIENRTEATSRSCAPATDALPPLLRAELGRLRRRPVLALELIHEVEAERIEALAATAEDAATRKIAALQGIRDIGTDFAAV